MNPIAIVLHHAASSKYASIQDIANVGIRQHGIPDYHFIVDYKGNFQNVLPMTEVAAHCGLDIGEYSESGVYNQNSIAICAIGNFETEIMPELQINGIVKCIRNIRIKYPKLFIKLHRELVNTACPGKNYPFKEILKRLEGVKITEIILNTQGSNRDYAIINGVKKQMPLHLVEVKGRNMIDLRFICEELGANITWDPNKKQIIIRRS
jgi:N-acetyl-anhydromuramyl-L-alanine amidase AmpD